MKTLAIFSLLMFSGAAFGQNTYGDIIGTLVDTKNEPMIGVTAQTSYGEAIYRAKTDLDGRFRISGIPAGSYTVMFFQLGDTATAPRKAEVAPDGYGDLGTVTFQPDNAGKTIEVVEVMGDRIRLTRGVSPEIKLTYKDIKISPVRNDINKLVASMTTDVKLTEDGSLVFRGARKGDLVYYIDGVKMGETANIPSVAMGYVMVYSGAIPAKYGDTNGGVIVVETKSYFDLYREWQARD